MLHSFSFGELALIFGIIIILFGGSRLASIGKSLGEGIANLKRLNSTEEKAQTSSQASFANDHKIQMVANPQISGHPNSSHQVEHIVDVETKGVNKG